LFGVLGLVTLGLGKLFPWVGVQRYRAVGAIVPLVIGIAVLAIGAPELAWIWLIPAAVIASAPAPIALLAAPLPAIFVLHPLQLREAYWNGFLPESLPLAAWVGMLAIPLAATLALCLRSLRPSRVVVIVLALVYALAIGSGIAYPVVAKPQCTAEQFAAQSLGCELVSK
jgi:hypothetical protein